MSHQCASQPVIAPTSTSGPFIRRVCSPLRAATIGNAEKLGLQEEVGSLEVGKIADFLVLDENPLDDIINTLSLKYTVQGGVIYDSNTAERIHPEAISSIVH